MEEPFLALFPPWPVAKIKVLKKIQQMRLDLFLISTMSRNANGIAVITAGGQTRRWANPEHNLAFGTLLGGNGVEVCF